MMITTGSGTIQYGPDNQRSTIEYRHTIFSGSTAFAELHARIKDGTVTRTDGVDRSSMSADAIVKGMQSYWQTRWPDVSLVVHQTLNGHPSAKAILLQAFVSKDDPHQNWNSLWVQSPLITDKYNLRMFIMDLYTTIHEQVEGHVLMVSFDRDYIKTVKSLQPRVEVPGVLSSGIRKGRKFSGMIGQQRVQAPPSVRNPGSLSSWVKAY
jgi:hypothetical protein